MLNSKVISMLIGLGMMSACSEREERGRDAQNDNGTDITMSLDEGDQGGANVSLDLTGIKGKLSLPKIKLGTGDVDIDGVKLYPGSRVTGIDIAGEDGRSEGSLTIRFDSEAAPETVRAYFVKALKDKGVEAAAEGSRIAGRDKDGKPFSITLGEQGNGTRGVLKLGSKAQ